VHTLFTEASGDICKIIIGTFHYDDHEIRAGADQATSHSFNDEASTRCGVCIPAEPDRTEVMQSLNVTRNWIVIAYTRDLDFKGIDLHCVDIDLTVVLRYILCYLFFLLCLICFL
jgi:hypothetical protein